MDKSTSAMSMTGFGSKEASLGSRAVSVRIRSVNQRFLELHFKIPTCWAHLELDLRKRVQSRVSRGKIDVSIFWRDQSGEGTGRLPQLNKELLRAYKALYLEGISEVTGVQSDVTIGGCRDILKREGVITLESGDTSASDDEVAFLTGLFDEALDDFVRSRSIEGEACVQVLRNHLDDLVNLVANLRELSGGLINLHVDKLRKRVQDLLQGQPIEECRFAQEIAYLSDRYDVTEEIHRLAAHVAAVETLLSEGVQGKKLDFLCQEMFREINTIGSKVQNVELQHLVVEFKGSIEKVREQAQNLE
jgi:uncharacterized protein (TIGR00255 family)